MTTEKRLIDAYALDRVLEDFENRHTKSCFVITAKAISKVRQIVYAMKDVDAVEVVHGRWIPTYKVNWWMGTQDIDGFTCNQCARHFKSKLRLNYCPNCGADMRGETE